MFWLSLIVGLQFLGFGITLVPLAYDEWQQWRMSRNVRKVDWGSPDLEEVQTMENRTDNLTPVERGADKPVQRYSRRFSYPQDVVFDPDLHMDERRAILAAWASDAHAVESKPTLRYLPGTPAPVTFSSIMDARAQLDSIFNVANDDDPPSLPPPLRMCDRKLSLEAA